MMNDDIKKVLFSEEDLEKKIKEIGKKITNDYQDKEPLIVGLLKGVIPFIGDLMKRIDLYCEIDYLRVSSYEGTASTGKLQTSGYVPDVLKSITMVSDDFKVSGSGYCGKGHKEWVRVSDGGPHLKAKVKLG